MITWKAVADMQLEWFDRVCGKLQDSLQTIFKRYDENGRMLIERGAKHPRIDFISSSGEEDRDYFCTLFFDPPNEEFYLQSIDPYYGHRSKVVLNDIEDIIDIVHEHFLNYIDDNLSEKEIMEEETDFVESVVMENELSLTEINVDWQTPEALTYYNEDDEAKVSYKFDLAKDTGEGVIKRINHISTNDGNLLADETIISFSKEEASKLIAMIASHLDLLDSNDEHV